MRPLLFLPPTKIGWQASTEPALDLVPTLGREVAWSRADRGQPALPDPLADAGRLQLRERSARRHHADHGLREHAVSLPAEAQLPCPPLLALGVAPPSGPRPPGLQEAPPGRARSA